MAAGKPRVLVVDDEPHERQGLSELIAAWGYAVEGAADGAQALEKLAAAPAHVVITDIRMPRMDGLQLLARIRQTLGDLPVLVLTGQGSKEAVVECLRLRANDYIEKPIRGGELKQRLADLVSEALRAAAPAEAGGGREREDADAEEWEFAGESKAVQEIRALIQQVAPTTASVLITGESGTGKEVVARRIHQLSPRRERTFLAVNCSAIPESLMESELFGHEKGAFTGAVERRAGCFELAENGTLLLDEIGEMPLPTQAKLLRVLEDRRLRRLGSKAEMPVNVRVLAATNKDPAKAVASGQLRGDLYYRLNVFHLHLPPLREHLEDLELLCTTWLRRLNRRHGRQVLGISPALLAAFRRHLWPGNVRELRNALERAVIVCDGPMLEPRHLAPDFGRARPVYEDDAHSVRVPVGTTVAEAERLLILKTLAGENNNKTRAAERLGISLKTLQNKLKEYGAASRAAEAEVRE
ncbi:MAG TPA: sigma-54 dependent transcriptional regulator [Terriglobales bacterium]|nr:sigma-54 dependent transcriptional regulator [Terriglobales bacterium]